jgi:hypothetical protein
MSKNDDYNYVRNILTVAHVVSEFKLCMELFARSPWFQKVWVGGYESKNLNVMYLRRKCPSHCNLNKLDRLCPLQELEILMSLTRLASMGQTAMFRG